MTPQLQQAIRLLQLSTLDLQLEIQNALDSNLMLEAEEEQQDAEHETEDTRDSSTDELGEREAPAAESEREVDSAVEDTALSDELPVDSGWDEIYDNYDGSTALSRPEEFNGRDIFENRSGGAETLRDHLMWQVEMSTFSDTDRVIATAIVDGVDEDGYLTLPLEEIHLGLAELQVDFDEVEAVLRRVQHFDPVGVAARDPSECLLIQLGQLPEDTPWLAEAKSVLSKHSDLLAARDFTQITRRMRISRDQLMEVMALVQTLTPRPGSMLPGPEPQYVVPDVYVSKREGTWAITLNNETSPRLRINQQYAGLVRRADNSADNQCMRNHLQEARWFLKSLQNRSETLLKVATAIVERQRGFLEYGEEAMKPLVLRDVAEAVEMHESTVSRVTTQKYMHTPRGIFEFKYFFSSHVGTADGGECSSTAIRAMIKKLIAEEPPRKPLSDSKIAQVLGKEGIQVARRTVAKYRESMSISSSTERKRLG
jgi:RNA polymerase sigma-54 factor